MPSSVPIDLRFPVAMIVRLQPGSILDLGIGFGRWGFLLREFLDIFWGRIQKKDWRIRIDGVEIYEPYIMPHHQFLYDNIHVCDARDFIKTCGTYDVTVIGDMLEHLPMAEAVEFFHAVMGKTNMGLLLNIPLGPCDQKGEENVYETHLSTWEEEDVMSLHPHKYQAYQHADGGRQGAFFFIKQEYVYYRALSRAGELERGGRIEEAARECASAISVMPQKPDAYMSLADILIAEGHVEKAVETLAEMGDACPDYLEGSLILASLLLKLRHADRAGGVLRTALEKATDGSPEKLKARELLAEAEALLK